MLLNSPNKPMRDEILEILFNTLPYVFWKDISGKYQGGNKNQARNLGFKSTEEFIGKTIFEILKDDKTAQLIDDADNQVMKDNRTLVYEEKIVELTGEKIYLSQKSPIHNDNGAVIGMIGFAMDITDIKRREELAKKETENYMIIAAQKEAERLIIENEARKAQLATQEKFTKTANQVAHDIRSPLASLLMIVKSCKNIPEKERIALQAASTRINDIANNLLHQYQPKKYATSVESTEQKTILLSEALDQLLTEKKFQYEDDAINFDYQCDNCGQFAFIEIEPSSFKRMLSNIINNAVDAIRPLRKLSAAAEFPKRSNEDKPGKILLTLAACDDWITITVQDNGKGMSKDLINKIMSDVAVTEGKADGNGIGLTQVRETLRHSKGHMSIHSNEQEGTQIILTFPKAPPPLSRAPLLRRDDNFSFRPNTEQETKIVDAVLIDDDEKYANALINYVFDDGNIDYFASPQLFKERLSDYPKNTRIYLDNHFSSSNINGVEFAEELHKKGYTRLYLLSGNIFKNKKLPDYLTVILKTDTDKIKDW